MADAVDHAARSVPCVVILDDDPLVGQTFEMMVRREGMSPVSFTEPEPFFQALERLAPKFLILDLLMPSMDGVDVIQKLAERSCPASIILASGVDQRVLGAAKRAAVELGLDILGALTKPVRPSELHALFSHRIDTQGPERRGASSKHAAPVGEAELKQALTERQFVLAYQPKVDCRTGGLAGFEALVRWQHPERGLVMPDQFIGLAEGSGLIDALTLQIFEQGVEWLATTAAGSDLHLAMNVSAASLGKVDLARSLGQLCEHHGLASSRITLELTETAAMRDPTASLTLLTQLRMRGFSLSIDDFGSGYSSMVQLVRLPFSEMKIDRSFVMTALRSPESRAVVQCIASLARGLRLKVTAEGVEDLGVVPLLRDSGCHYAQGFAIARPMPAAGVAQWHQDWKARAAAAWST
jgi:EAL domain-containing protein (putative c-di-GMP-specific phosphodiesterase class I)/ActR/RegA family two-component response regulator